MRSMRTLGFWLLLVMVSALLASPAALAQQGKVDPLDPQLPPAPAISALFEGARLITGDGSAPIENSAFIVENGKFTRVGRKGELQPPPGGTRVDLTGKTVIPGLIDGHNHIGYDNKMQARDWRLYEGWGPQNFEYSNIMDDMRRFAYYGIVATWDAGYGFGTDQYRVMIDTLTGKDSNAARYIGAGTGMAETNAGPNMRQSTYVIDSPEEGRRVVDVLAAKFEPVRAVGDYKVPLLKYWVDNTPYAIFSAVVDEAHKRNMRVTTGGGKDELGWIRAGGDGYAHSPNATDEVLAALKEANKGPKPKIMMQGFTMINNSRWWYAPDLFPPIPLLTQTMNPLLIQRAQDQFNNETPELKEHYKEASEKEWVKVKKLLACNCIPIGFGSDGSARMGPWKWPGHSGMRELENYEMAGMTPAQVIVAATKTSAEVLGLDDLGTIAAGKSADFVVLDANPLDDITNTRKISDVYMRGKKVNRAGLAAFWAKFWKEAFPRSFE